MIRMSIAKGMLTGGRAKEMIKALDDGADMDFVHKMHNIKNLNSVEVLNLIKDINALENQWEALNFVEVCIVDYRYRGNKEPYDQSTILWYVVRKLANIPTNHNDVTEQLMVVNSSLGYAKKKVKQLRDQGFIEPIQQWMLE